MATRSPVKMISEMGVRSMIGSGGEGFNGEDLGFLLREQRMQEANDRERELNIYRSGSAPPTVEGSLNAIGGFFGGDSSSSGVMPEFSGAKDGNGLISEEEMRSDPAYQSYYYSHVNLNPRLPPPVLSKEDWRSTQRLGGIGDRRKANRCEEGNGGGSLFNRQPGFSSQDGNDLSGEWLDGGGDGLIGLSLGRQKSFADIFQDDLGRSTSTPGHISRPTSRGTFNERVETLCSAENQLSLHHEIASVDGMQPGRNAQSVGGLKNTTSQTFASVLGSSLSRNTTPDPQLVARAVSPSLPPVGIRVSANDKKMNNDSRSFNGMSSNIIESDDILAALSGMSLSTGGADTDNISQLKRQQEVDDHRSFLFDFQNAQNHMKQHAFSRTTESGHSNMSSMPHPAKFSSQNSAKSNAGLADFSDPTLGMDRQVELCRPIVHTNSYLKAPPAPSVASPSGSPAHYQSVNGANAAFTSYGLSGYPVNPALPSMLANRVGTGSLPPLFENAAAASAIAALGMDSRTLSGGGFSSGLNLNGTADIQSLSRSGNHSAAAPLQMPSADPNYIQYLKSAEYAARSPANRSDSSMERGYVDTAYLDLIRLQEAYIGALLQPHKYSVPVVGKSGTSSHGYYGSPAFGMNMSYPGSPLPGSVPASPVGPGSPLRHGERNLHFSSGMSGLAGNFMGSWRPDTSGNMDEGFQSTLLEEFKSSKTRCFELSEIIGHVVEFSADQYGSRFIQQKLETATTEEKNMVFEEIMPQTLTLMTDVFGNYVIQKFFEHGTAAQIRELANQLNGHVLALSLQMYGCRVIQKAIEVVNLDQQTKMVAELDGHVMRCVRDQNGNHVIQKCIECIPQDAIQFIISSFYDQVVTLSTHPYGCRVIQRVLEHCDDPKTQQIMMDEILQNVCMLAQDQYGNYVVQHVLEHGKPHERSAIIKKLAGQIVQMSQQKFASNVVEKCLTFGGPAEREILVNEMLGTTDENEPLQAMMKDQFANYVVQKVLETCDDQQRELILSRIKVHLNALKKYTYGKHIVARVEKLVTAGERRIALQPSYLS